MVVMPRTPILIVLLVLGCICFVLFAFTLVGLVGEAVVLLALAALMARGIAVSGTPDSTKLRRLLARPVWLPLRSRRSGRPGCWSDAWVKRQPGATAEELGASLRSARLPR